MNRTLDLYLYILSPVHIGCDEVYEPTTFTVDEQRRKLISFDPMDFITSLTPEERERFTKLCMEGSVSSLIGIYKFMTGRKIKGEEIEVAADFISHYGAVKRLPMGDEKKINQELNRFAIARTAFNPHSNMPYIPGSSLKGALRTAYLSALAKKEGIRNVWEGKIKGVGKERDDKIYSFIKSHHVAQELERNLLKGSFDTDPFRMVKVSDFLPFGNVKTKIAYAVNRKKKEARFEARGIAQILEVLQPGAVFKGTINIQQPHERAKIEEPVSFESLWSSLGSFYRPLLEAETKVLADIGADGKAAMAIQEKFPAGLGEKAMLVRCGRHSGAESVTIEGNRYIRIMQAQKKPPKFASAATTLWLAAESRRPSSNRDLFPFGWAILSTEPIEYSGEIKAEKREGEKFQTEVKTQHVQMTHVERFISEIRKINPTDAGRIGSTIDRALKELASDEDKRTFARAVRDYIGKEFKRSKAKAKLEKYLKV